MEWIMEHSYACLWGAGILLMLLFYLRHRRRIRAMMIGGLSGLLSLILAHCFGGILGFAPSLCLTNLLISVLLGVPGVALILLGGIFLT